MPEAVVAGHICLDVIPTFAEGSGALEQLLVPGTLVSVGPAVTSTGGAVSNTGLALHRLGVSVGLVGKVGEDLFGAAVLAHLRGYDAALADGMVVAPEARTSYTIVLSPPGVDRLFLHDAGANDDFAASDVSDEVLAGARLFHFGYPPIMRAMYADGGTALAGLLERVRAAGLTTSLDMAYPDASAAAGRVDWPAFLARVLPHVDVFTPSLDETLFMLDRRRHDALHADGGELSHHVDDALIRTLARRLIDLGAGVVGLKLGDQGLYVRTSPDPRRLERMGRAAPKGDSWRGRSVLAPCFRADVDGTTGAGDATSAGLLAALLHGLPLERAMRAAVAVGACSTERPDATSAVPPWGEVLARVDAGWGRHRPVLSLDGGRWDEVRGLWRAQDDGTPPA